MERFDTLREVDALKYLDSIMQKLTTIENENNLKDKKLYNYDLEVRRLQQENINLHNQLNYYKQISSTLNDSVQLIKNTGEQIRENAMREREVIISDAKNTASRILNDALIRSEKIEMETNNLKKNMVVYKNKLRTLINCQLEIIDDIEVIEI